MRLTGEIFAYEGDYITGTNFIYRGIGSSNFLVIKSDRQVMIDSGIDAGPHRKRIRAELKRDGINPYDTRSVLLSHTHPDHILYAKKICKKSPLSFIVHGDSEPMARRSDYQFEAHYNFPEYVLHEVFNLPTWFARLVVKKYFDFSYLNIQRTVYDGDMLDLGIPARIVSIPAHFPGHVGVMFEKERIFYSADLFDFRVAEGGIINNALSSYEQVFRDIEKVNSLDIETMIPGHGRPVLGRSMVKTMLDRVFTGTENYIKNINAAISTPRKGKPLGEITSAIFTDSNAYNVTARRIIIHNTLMYMRSAGLADFRLENGVALWRA